MYDVYLFNAWQSHFKTIFFVFRNVKIANIKMSWIFIQRKVCRVSVTHMQAVPSAGHLPRCIYTCLIVVMTNKFEGTIYFGVQKYNFKQKHQD